MVLIISGMHRSGTSLIASYLNKCGLSLGHDLMAADSGNPNGYFEDSGFVDLHNEILKSNGMGYFESDFNDKIVISDEQKISANDLISRFKNKRTWGWKDPRTCLFLEFWDSFIKTDKLYFFIFRNPLEVLLSLLRRNLDHSINKNPNIALQTWYAYNCRILKFIEKTHSRYVLCSLNNFLAHPKLVVKEINSLGADLSSNIELNDVFVGSDLNIGLNLRNSNAFRLLKINPVLLLKCTKLHRRLLKEEYESSSYKYI